MEVTQELTPEVLGEWLVREQRPFFYSLVDASQTAVAGFPPLDLSAEELVEMSCHAYAIQVAIVALSYHEGLDDSRFLQGTRAEGVDIVQFLRRLQAGARKASEPYTIIDTPEFEPYAVAGCVIELDVCLPSILFYYSAFFVDLAILEVGRPDAVRFAKHQVGQMKTTNPSALPTSLAYYYAFQNALTDGGRVPCPDIYDECAARVVLHTWEAWTLHLVSLQRRLIAFVGDRKPRF